MEPYTSTFLISRLYEELSTQQNSNKKISLQKPDISSANKKTYISNFRSLCSKLHRDEHEVKIFFEKELLTTTSLNVDGCLIITGVFRQPGLLKIFTNYIKEYVTCKECNSCDTEIIKENRIMFLKCNRCLSKKAFN